MDKERVLFVGAGSRSREMITLLERRRYDVFQALDTEQAKEALQVQQFGLVICDPSISPDRLHWTPQPETGWLVELHDSDTEPSLERRTKGAGTEAVIAGLGNLERVTELLDRLLIQHSKFASNPCRDGLASLNLPVLDHEKFERQMSNDPALMSEIIDLYIDETAKQVRELEVLVRQQEVPTACRLAHTLKGSFSAVFASRAGGLAKEIELAMASGDFGLAAALLEPLKQSADEAETELHQFLGAK